MPRSPQHRATAQTVWTLMSVVLGTRDIVGQYSTEATAMAEAHRRIAAACGLKQLGRTVLPPWRTEPDGAKQLVYGRDTQSFWFRLEPWVVDGEQQ